MGCLVEDQVPHLSRLKPGMDLRGKASKEDGWELDFGISCCIRQHRERLPDRLGALGRLCVAVLWLSFPLATNFGAGLSFAAMVSIARRLSSCSPSSGHLRHLKQKVRPL